MRNIAGALVVAAALASGQTSESLDFRHLYTIGSKHGIHPPKTLNRKPAIAVLGESEHPYGIAYPVSVAIDLRGRVWITDSATASVHVFDRVTGAYREIKRVGDVLLQKPSGLAVDAQGRVYLSDSATGGIYVFDEQGEYDRALFKRGERTLESPTALALSEDGRTIYVADPPKNVVVELNREGEVDGAIKLPVELADPKALCVVSNQIYVLENRLHKVEIFSPGGRLRGELKWEGIQFPSAFSYDKAHRRFLVSNPRLMVVEVFNEEGQNLGAFGQFGEGIDQMQRVDSLHVDSQGLVYLVDSRSGKVLVFGDSQTH